jgi:deoxyribose-phosphate aldolase
MSKIVRKCRKCVVKAIIETAYLSESEIEKLVKVLIRAKVDYVMTSSGYAPLGSTVELIEKLSSLSANKIGIKASGGIKTRLDAESFIRLGATRIGTSRIL